MAYKTSLITKVLANSLNFKHGLLSQRPHTKLSRFLSSDGENFFSSEIIWPEFYFSLLANKTTEPPSAAASPQLLSKLFPQTAISDEADVKKEQEKQKQQDEGWFLNNWMF